MKKVVLSLAVIAMISFVSCKETKTEEVAPETTTEEVVTPEVTEEVAPEATVDTAAAPVEEAHTEEAAH
ncbi:hypothetical protein FUA48_01600 [Flavobacterium alkalisoli]|uniref:Uncharacterized protein n=1 Tax=Flavobacterium alkalisoli TaxID=2602769 RepID=A0A5B9FNH0_9FLAO|nr:hypothetical protein [Flavobacterium alkalisoli]QEE48315.1 hypothetical protein FUA48_01600 [Flavobacterium alkalisoli]